MSSCRLVLLGEDGENPPASLPAFFLFNKDSTTLGRSRRAEITLDSETYPNTLSRTHINIWKKNIPHTNDYQWHITDLNTMNGTFIDGVKIHESAINDGEILTLGGGAGLEMGQRSNMLASDLVFRFEVLVQDDSKPAPTSGARATPFVTSPSSAPPPAAPTTPIDMMPPTKDTASSLSHQPPPPSDPSAPKAAPNAAPNAAPKAAATQPNFKTDSGLLAVAAHVTQSQARHAIDNSSGNVLLAQQKLFRESMLAEVKCAVCCDFFLNACTLTCSHSFCQKCIEECLYRKHECPICRALVVTRPVPSNHLNNIVQTLMNPQERKEYDRRCQSELSKEAREKTALDTLKKKLKKARNGEGKEGEGGSNFLHIQSRWTTKERNTFSTGVNQYRGEARKLYCDATGKLVVFGVVGVVVVFGAVLVGVVELWLWVVGGGHGTYSLLFLFVFGRVDHGLFRIGVARKIDFGGVEFGNVGFHR